jgi:hypothetical protein
MSLHDIPALNAGLNALATVLMTCGFLFIRQALRQPVGPERTAALARHREGLAALALSLGFSFATHRTDQPPELALLALFQRLEGG